MTKKKSDFSRRDFIKTASAVGIGSILSPVESLTYVQAKSDHLNESQPKVVPTRPFGKTGVKVSILGLGGAFHWSNLLLLKQALKMGVTYWDTAITYGNGQSEKAIGKYFLKYPEDRKKVFLVTKSVTSDPHSMTRSLETSLERMKTSYIDLYFIHQVADAYKIDRAAKVWAEEAKAIGKIRFFGFSTHKNMEKCLLGAAKLGWIDGIMLSYNFRIMHTKTMKKAVDNCFSAGIGLTAMKTQAKGGWGTEKITPDDKEQHLFNQFKKGGLTVEQAKLKAVWSDNRFASICSYMTNMTVLQANVAAALSKTKLSFQNRRLSLSGINILSS
jgi:aryl-alcohol dehydrogenase-like predicted oxidoreductase